MSTIAMGLLIPFIGTTAGFKGTIGGLATGITSGLIGGAKTGFTSIGHALN